MHRLHRFTLIASASVIVFVGLGIWSNLRSELAGDYESQLFYGQLYGDLLDNYRGVAVVAHNSGNLRASLRSAQDAGIPIVEIDVRTVNDQLYAAHAAPAPIVGHYFTRSVPLSSAWNRSETAPAVILDLKDSSDTFLNRLIAFLETHYTGDRDLIISSRSEYALGRMSDALPDATLLLSVASRGQLTLAQSDPALTELIDGITVYSGLLEEEEDVALLKENGMLVYVWVVNNLNDLNRLVRWGIDAVTTDNLAIIELLAPNIEEDLQQAEDEASEAEEAPAEQLRTADRVR